MDRYGRLLAQVFVGEPERAGSEPSAAGAWVQGELVRSGLARAYGLDGNASCLTDLLSHERVAREAAIGLWKLSAYAVRDADDVDRLLQQRGTFQIVEGKVRAVSELRTTTFVNFGEDVRQDFTISIRASARRNLAAAGVDPQQWAGRTIRVRGWIERRGGPLIEINHPGDVEALGDADADPTVAVAPAASNQAAIGRRSRVRAGAPADAPHQ